MKNNNSNDRPIVEAALESGEVVTDILMRGDALAEIPVIGTAIKICKAADAFRDRAFAIKLSKFVQHLEDITEEQKDKLKEKMLSGEAQKVGETLFFVLEHVTDLDKPSLLSQIFLAYIDGVVTGEELRRLSRAVDMAFADDLKQLLKAEVVQDRSYEPWMRYLVPSGLTQLVGSGALGSAGTLYCEITPLGKKLISAYSYGKSTISH